MDAHAFALTCAQTTGDDWSIAHDGYLAVLADELGVMGVRTAIEINGLFRSCIPDPVQRAAGALPRDPPTPAPWHGA